jgi:hypothetical protein
MPTDHYIWVFAGAFADYAMAAAKCESFHYKLPDETAFAEFKEQLYAKKPWSNSFKPEEVHIIDKTQALDSGVVFCILPRL